MKYFNYIKNIVNGLLILFLILVIALLLLSTFEFPGNIKIYSIQSGSMEPTLALGSVVVVKPEDKYFVGDIITFIETDNSPTLITHRIVGIDEDMRYITKGDANTANDFELREDSGILGKVIFNIPLLGYLVNYMKTSQGLFLLIIFPGILVIFNEISNIKTEVKKIKENRSKVGII